MRLLAELSAVVAGAIHLWIFAMESVLFRRPAVHGMFEVAAEHVPVVRLWAFHQGFYNLGLGVAVLTGVALLHTGRPVEGQTLILYATATMLAAALVLVAADPRRRRLPGLAAQALPALVALGALIS
jgi:putative membrane protein